jgi:transcriptional regulator with XRE-family HTH domain
MKEKNSLPARIKLARQKARLSQKELARLIGITSQSVNQWESGATQPSRANLIQTAKWTRVEISWLMTGEGLSEQKVTASIADSVDGGRFVPMLSVNEALARTQPAADAPRYYAHFPCSDNAFIVSLPNDSNAPSHPAGTRWVIDPDQAPLPGDLVFAAVDGQAAFGEYQTESTPQGRIHIIKPLNEKWGAHRSDVEHINIVGRVTEYARQP